MATIAHLLTRIRALASDRARLAMENAALRQQFIVMRRAAKRARINGSDRVFMGADVDRHRCVSKVTTIRGGNHLPLVRVFAPHAIRAFLHPQMGQESHLSLLARV